MGWSCRGAREGIVGMTWREGGNHMHQKIDSLMIGQICRIEYILCRQDTTLILVKKNLDLIFFHQKTHFFAFLDYSHQARHLDGLELG